MSASYRADQDDAPHATAAASFTELAKLTAEISERLEEMDALKIGESMRLLHRLSQLASRSPPAYSLTIRALHSPDALLSSYADQSQRPNWTASKQAIHAELKDELSVIEPFFPELARTIRQMREQIGRRIDADNPHNVDNYGRVRTANRSNAGAID